MAIEKDSNILIILSNRQGLIYGVGVVIDYADTVSVTPLTTQTWCWHSRMLKVETDVYYYGLSITLKNIHSFPVAIVFTYENTAVAWFP